MVPIIPPYSKIYSSFYQSFLRGHTEALVTVGCLMDGYAFRFRFRYKDYDGLIEVRFIQFAYRSTAFSVRIVKGFIGRSDR